MLKNLFILSCFCFASLLGNDQPQILECNDINIVQLCKETEKTNELLLIVEKEQKDILEENHNIAATEELLPEPANLECNDTNIVQFCQETVKTNELLAIIEKEQNDIHEEKDNIAANEELLPEPVSQEKHFFKDENHLCRADYEALLYREIYHEKLQYPDTLVIASPGRSGSHMLTDTMLDYAVPKYRIGKTHLLPPTIPFQAKIIFIFSNPDKVAESILNKMINHYDWFSLHVKNVETTDLAWVEKVGKGILLEDNLLTYDALGSERQLKEWLFIQTIPCPLEKAQILAVKYENIWEPETIAAIKEFLQVSELQLPTYQPRSESYMSDRRINALKTLYNEGSNDEPKYRAYEEARVYWKFAPSFMYLKMRSSF